jgi:hypothetical protein
MCRISLPLASPRDGKDVFRGNESLNKKKPNVTVLVILLVAWYRSALRVGYAKLNQRFIPSFVFDKEFRQTNTSTHHLDLTIGITPVTKG